MTDPRRYLILLLVTENRLVFQRSNPRLTVVLIRKHRLLNGVFDFLEPVRIGLLSNGYGPLELICVEALLLSLSLLFAQARLLGCLLRLVASASPFVAIHERNPQLTCHARLLLSSGVVDESGRSGASVALTE